MSSGVAVVDVNGDGRDDLFFSNDGAPDMPGEMLAEYQDQIGNSLFLNLGTSPAGSVEWSENVAEQAGVRGLGHKGIGVSAADYDNDGDQDLYVTNGQRGFGMAGFGGMRVEGGERMQPLPPDVFVSERTDGFHECEGRNTLYRNDGDTDGDGIPNFTDVTEEAGVAECRHGSSTAWADVDLDGDLDLYVGNFVEPDWMAFNEEFFNGTRDTLFRNNGDGTFTDITIEAGVPGRKMFAYDWNGERIPAFNPELEDSRGRTVGEDHSTTHVVGFMDYDGDFYPDLFSVSDAPGTIAIFHNNGDGTFTDVSEEAGVDLSGDWMGIAFGDIDGDGDLDMFNSNFGSDWFTKAKSVDTFMIADAGELNRWGKGTSANKLWRFDGVREIEVDGQVIPVPIVADIGRAMDIEWGEVPPGTIDPAAILREQTYTPLGLEHTEFGFGSIFLDFDNDTRQDLYVVGSLGRGCGETKCETPPGGERFNQRGPGRLLQNLGNGGMSWRDVTFETQTFNIAGEDYETGERLGLDFHEQGRGAAKGDFNGDGFPDFVVTNIGGFDSNFPEVPEMQEGMKAFTPGPTFVYLNPGYDNNWLKVKTEGTLSNRDGIGALVRVTLPSGKVLVEQVTSGTSYLSQNSLTLIFGLGDAASVDRVDVQWPSGWIDTLLDVGANQLINVTEAEDTR
jgi:hypothetical protein